MHYDHTDNPLYLRMSYASEIHSTFLPEEQAIKKIFLIRKFRLLLSSVIETKPRNEQAISGPWLLSFTLLLLSSSLSLILE